MEEANKSASDVSKLKDILSSILLICKVFYSLNFQVSWHFTELKAVFLLKLLLFFNIYFFCFWIKWERFYTSINNHSWSEECDWWGRDLCLNNRKLTFHTDHIKCAVVWVYNCLFCSLQASSPFGAIMKSTCASGMRRETWQQGAGERKESLRLSLINFHFHSRNPRTL